MSNFCKNCGAQLNLGVKFCSTCGTKVQTEAKNVRNTAFTAPEYVAPNVKKVGIQHKKLLFFRYGDYLGDRIGGINFSETGR